MPQPLTPWRPPRPRARSQKERAHYLSADWRARRGRILIRDAFTCRSCSRVVDGQAAHVDHIIPLEDFGTDDEANLQTLCASCHGRKTRQEQRQKGYA